MLKYYVIYINENQKISPLGSSNNIQIRVNKEIDTDIFLNDDHMIHVPHIAEQIFGYVIYKYDDSEKKYKPYSMYTTLNNSSMTIDYEKIINDHIIKYDRL